MRVVVAGASGFVGRALLPALSQRHDVVALSRDVGGRADGERVTWRACDLFNLLDAERALAGADVAVYLVHSMMPSAELTQASFEDLDLLCADNFARAAAKAGVQRIVYLGGLLPSEDVTLSRHLESRAEVERALAAYGVPVTTLRAGLVVGAGGSSFDMMAKLVKRLPLMVGPRWTQTRTQPIALDDVIPLLALAVDDADLAGRAYDVGGPDVVTYGEMLRMTARAFGKRARILSVPVRTVKLSLLWVTVITGAPQALVRPLVESLAHDMVVGDGATLQARAGQTAQPLAEALARAVEAEKARAPRAKEAPPRAARSRPPPRVTSVQRFRVREGRDAASVADAYLAWLPRVLSPVLRVSVSEARTCRFYARPIAQPLLELTFAPERSSPDRQLFYVTGGLLAAAPESGVRPRLEFRQVLGGAFVLAAVLDFTPRLPWLVYKLTQAVAHLLVMRAFGRHLAREGRAA